MTNQNQARIPTSTQFSDGLVNASGARVGHLLGGNADDDDNGGDEDIMVKIMLSGPAPGAP